MPRKLTSASSVDGLKRDAKRWLKALRAGNPTARELFARAYPNAPDPPGLRDVQHALAREYGVDNWLALKQAAAALHAESTAGQPPSADAQSLERVAGDLVADFNNKDDAALERTNAHYQRRFTFDDLWAEVWRRVYAFRQRSSRGSLRRCDAGKREEHCACKDKQA